ncbi:hypothetical protein CWB85_03345 [Pseudoalteromonas sp. S1727]|uniref:hypothetical protein n=1 Tax=Pseudoalteromonas sp. S1727 TaxID=2066514 RepID=UPI001107F27D|nr:hypothetical protein [Pseudoalteromonas sp. S1727]TMN73713.1 hypothetical protein CWB85_03345 [Pseudoalteromonas sp. S1727]
MQAKLEQLEDQLNLLKLQVAEQQVEKSTAQLELFLNSLKDVFSQPQKLNLPEQVRLQEMNQQLIILCQQLQDAKDSSKSDLSNLMKNKKKVGLYNQLK